MFTCHAPNAQSMDGLFKPDDNIGQSQQQPTMYDPNTPDNNSNCQSPASMDLSVNIPTPPSQNQSSGNSNYSPPNYYQDFSGGGVGGAGMGMTDPSSVNGGAATKNMFNWDMLDFDGPEFDQAMANGGFMTGGGIHTMSADMSDFFTGGSG